MLFEDFHKEYRKDMLDIAAGRKLYLTCLADAFDKLTAAGVEDKAKAAALLAALKEASKNSDGEFINEEIFMKAIENYLSEKPARPERKLFSEYGPAIDESAARTVDVEGAGNTSGAGMIIFLLLALIGIAVFVGANNEE